MHEPMYDHPGVLEAIETLEAWGVSFVDPRIEEGKAKIASEDAIALETARAAAEGSLSGAHVVVTSGATSEPIDPVRIVTNRASGRTGRAVAKACYARGAAVTLVHDGGEVPYAATRQVERAAQMREAVLDVCDDADALVSAAAIGDYTVDAADEKLRSGQPHTLELEPTPKLIDAVRERVPALPIVGFKLETGGDDGTLIDAARETLDRAGLAFVVANDAAVMGESDTRVLLVGPEEATEVVGSKAEVGGRIVDELAADLPA
jgi:phosphopantothenoylcysteine decarboxylase/phosphopantothenate--cysteine ligase